jgi:hypothetical protein
LIKIERCMGLVGLVGLVLLVLFVRVMHGLLVFCLFLHMRGGIKCLRWWTDQADRDRQIDE